MGKIGWSEWEYFTASPESVYLAVEGYMEGKKHDEVLLRHQTDIIFKVMGGKQNMKSIWPIDENDAKPVEPMIMTSERYKALQKHGYKWQK